MDGVERRVIKVIKHGVGKNGSQWLWYNDRSDDNGSVVLYGNFYLICAGWNMTDYRLEMSQLRRTYMIGISTRLWGVIIWFGFTKKCAN